MCQRTMFSNRRRVAEDGAYKRRQTALLLCPLSRSVTSGPTSLHQTSRRFHSTLTPSLLYTSNLTMAGDDGVDPSKFKGFSKYYNSYTQTGRAGASAITLGVVGVGILYLLLKPKKK